MPREGQKVEPGIPLIITENEGAEIQALTHYIHVGQNPNFCSMVRMKGHASLS